MSDSFCPYYEQALLIDATPSAQTRIAMCCFQQRQPVDQVKFDHDYLLSLRQIGQKRVPKQCSKYCSMPGHIANERERSLQESWWTPGNNKLTKLHVKQGLICNLQCISCSSEFSSSWNKDYHLFDANAPTVRSMKNPRASWQDLDLSSVRQLHFDGGEPLLNPDMQDILEHMRDLGTIGQVTVNVSTNGTIMPSDELLNLWSQCQWVRIFFSLDGIESTFDYTRWPAQWSSVEKNILDLSKIQGPCLLLEVNAIVGIHNIFNMREFYNWWQQNLPAGNQGDPSAIFIKSIEPTSYGGQVLHLSNLPQQYKEQALELLDDISNCPGSKDLRPLLSTAIDNNWLGYLDKLDSIRKTNWRKMLPSQISAYKV